MFKFKEYFPHSIHAFNDIKLQILFDKFGFEGIGVFWFYLEEMAKRPNRHLLVSEFFYLAEKFKIRDEILQHLVTPYDNLFVKKSTYVYSKRLKEHFQKLDEISTVRSSAKLNKTKKSIENSIYTPFSINDGENERKKTNFSSPLAVAYDGVSNTLVNISDLNSNNCENQMSTNDNQMSTNVRYKNKIKEKKIKENKSLNNNNFDFFKNKFNEFFKKLIEGNSVVVPKDFTYNLQRAYKYFANNNVDNIEGYIYTIALDAFNKLLEHNYKKSKNEN